MTESNPDLDSRHCSALKKDGSQCRAWASKQTGRCPVHSPNAREIQVLGGKSKTRQHMLERHLPSRMKPVLDMLAKSMEQVHRGEISPQQGSSLAALAGALCKVSELSDLEIRISVLEVRLLKKGARTWEN
jgi:hypothetical protein